jgi:hypothetical protein
MQEYASLFGRAALVARDPERFQNLAELETEELDALTYERDHKWYGSKMLWYSISLCAVGAATQGWDQVRTRTGLTTAQFTNGRIDWFKWC